MQASALWNRMGIMAVLYTICPQMEQFSGYSAAFPGQGAIQRGRDAQLTLAGRRMEGLTRLIL